MTSPLRAVWLATSWLTVFPVPQPAGRAEPGRDTPGRAEPGRDAPGRAEPGRDAPGRAEPGRNASGQAEPGRDPAPWLPTRRDGGAALAATPVIGIVLGAALAAVAYGLSHTALPSLMIGLLLVAIAALVTRGMHLDGLADTADGLGCFGSAERAQQVMREGSVGPFGAATLVLTIAIAATGFGTLTAQQHWLSIGYAIVVGRTAAVLTARAPLKPMHANGFGALVIGTQRMSAALWTIATIAAGVLVDIDHPWRGPVTAAVALTIVWFFGAHCARRFDGLSGDTLGAVIEIATAATLIGLLV